MPRFPATTRSAAHALRAPALAVWLLATGFAQAPVPDPVDRLFDADAARLIESEDPLVRGEAALVLAAGGDPRSYPLVLAVARDRDPEARLRGLLALGYLGAPGTAATLEALLAETRTRLAPPGLVAAFALGLLPDDQAAAVVTRQLAEVVEGSFRRQRDVMLALLGALATRPAAAAAPGDAPQAPQLAVLRNLNADASLRDPVVRAAVLTVLGRVPGGLSDKGVRALLERGDVVERRALLAALATGPDEPDAALLRELEEVCTKDTDTEVRAHALAVLTRARHLPALDLAARAIRTDQPIAVEQGTRTALQLGGAPLRRAIERQLEFLSVPGQTALLLAFAGPMSGDFQATCERLAADAHGALPLRTAAALALAQAGIESAVPLLRELVPQQRDPALLLALTRALLQLTPSAELMPFDPDAPTSEMRRAAEVLRAQLQAGHTEASRFCLLQLQRKDLGAATSAVLRAVRLARLPAPPPALCATLPEPVQALLR